MKVFGTVVLAAAAVLAGCGAPTASAPHDEISAPVAPPPATGSASPFNATDVAWIQLMIPMDEQLVRVLGLAETRATPAVRAFARTVVTSHRAELTQLVALRTRAGVPATNVHEGHDMPGMQTEPEIVALSKLRGAAFDRVLAQHVKEHLDQSILVAKSIATAGQEPGVKQLAAAVRAGRTAQLKQLAALG